MEEFTRIQRDFVRDKQGVRALVGLIRDLSGRLPLLDPQDPVLRKGQDATERAIVELGVQMARLRRAEPPEAWQRFHHTLLESLRLQLEGYQEMTRVIQDWKPDHLVAGEALVRRGMSLLEAGVPE